MAAVWTLVHASAFAISVSNYSSTVNNRFESGFPTAPVENSSESFIGAGLDWSGVGWSTTTYANSSYKGFGMLSPMHFLTAQHYEYGSEFTQGVRILGQDGEVYTQSNASVSNLGYGLLLTNHGQTNYDLAVGTLSSAITSPQNMARMAVLDLNNSSTANSSSYSGRNLLLYGRHPSTSSGSPRVAGAAVHSVVEINSDSKQLAILTTKETAAMQIGDSGAPVMTAWTNPDGEKELTLLGLNSATNASYNFLSFLANFGAINAANAVMNPDGYALRVVGTPTNTWVGSSSSNINLNLAWGIGKNPNDTGGTSDKFVLFDSATASTRNVNVNANYNLRGLYFKSTAAANDGFTFGGSSTLTVGRGGVVNYDNDRQVFNAPLALGDAQYWDGGSGGITVAGTLNTAGKLLEITGTGTNRITGQISGTGSLALSGGSLELTASNTYSGTTWVHAGQLLVNNTTGSATGSGTVNIAPGGVLSGTGALSGNVVVSGIVAPGNGIGTLTAAGQLTWHSGDDWLFELATAGTTLAAAKAGESEQDRLDIGNSFLKGTGSEWSFNFAGTGDLGWYRLITWNADQGTTFLASDFSAYNLANDYTGSFTIDDGGLYIHVLPEPAVVSLIALSGLLAPGIRIWRRRMS